MTHILKVEKHLFLQFFLVVEETEYFKSRKSIMVTTVISFTSNTYVHTLVHRIHGDFTQKICHEQSYYNIFLSPSASLTALSVKRLPSLSSL
jgi:hypothetical protein